MLRATSIAISGMGTGENALSAIANNIANDQTVGYKEQEPVFEELFYQQEKSPVAPNGGYAGMNPIEVGNGVRLSTINTVHTQGNLNYTGNKTDMAIQGDGFFIVGDNQGMNRNYTRAGDFVTSKDNELITKSGQYVMGWNWDPLSQGINTSATLMPIKIELGKIRAGSENTKMSFAGNLNINSAVGTDYGVQVPSYDRLGSKHDLNYDFIKTSGNTFRYVVSPADGFKPSASVTSAVMLQSQALAAALQKGDYQIQVNPGGTAGTVDVSVIDPGGATLFTQNISDANQTVTLNDGTKNWFTINYVSGGTLPSTSTFTVGEVGDMTFNSVGQLVNATGSGSGGGPLVTYTPTTTGVPVNIDVDLKSVTALAADSGLKMQSTEGEAAATMVNYTITDGGVIDGYFSDGSVKHIAKVALATFSNPSGLSHVGAGNFIETPNSGIADVGEPGTNGRGSIKSQAVENSNVDLSKQFVDMLTNQKEYQANTKVIQTTDNIMTALIGLIR